MNALYSIALIEDSPSDILLLRMALDKSGLRYELKEIPDGRVALQSLAAAAQPPDMIITDFVVPGMDFDGLLAGLKSTPALQHVPVVVMSGMRDAKLSQRIKAQVADYLVKPASLEGWREIGEQLKHMLERS